MANGYIDTTETDQSTDMWLSEEENAGILSHLIRRLALAAEYRLHGDLQHIKRIRELTLITARALTLSESECILISDASQLHDIGMISIPDAILLKPGRLTLKERTTMESHTTTGARMLGRLDNEFVRTARAIALYHHEKWDGSGYPNQLTGEEIPLAARITKVVDALDAIQSARPHRRSVTPEVAITIMEHGGDGHFDPDVLKALLAQRDNILKIFKRIPNR